MRKPHPFTSGELTLHHRAGGAGSPITCGVSHGCITSVLEDVACPKCREVIDGPAEPEYAVRSNDGLNGEQITERPTLAEAIAYMEYLQRVSATRKTYFIRTELVERDTKDGPWLRLPIADALSRIEAAWAALDAAFAPVLEQATGATRPNPSDGAS